MSTLTENLQTIYEVKQEIKEVLGTSSDIFTEYPDLIEAAIGSGSGLDWDEVASYGYIVPAGTLNMKTNQNYDVSAYAYANVQVDIKTKNAPVLLVTSSYSYLDQEENEHTVRETKVYQHYGSDLVSHTDSNNNTWDAWEINLPCQYNSDIGRLEFTYSYQLSLNIGGVIEDNYPNKYIALNYMGDESNNPVLQVSGTVCNDLTLYNLTFNYYDENYNELACDGAIELGTNTLIAEGNWAANVTNCKLYIGVNWDNESEQFNSVFELVPETTS